MPQGRHLQASGTWKMKNNFYSKGYISVGFVNKFFSGRKTKIMNAFQLWYQKQVIHSLNYKDYEERLPHKIEEWSLCQTYTK